MSDLTWEQLINLLLENVPVGEKADVKMSVTKNRRGGWDVELPDTYKIEPKKESKNDSRIKNR